MGKLFGMEHNPRLGMGATRLSILAVILLTVLVGCESPEERAAGYLEAAEQYFEEDNLVKAELEVRNALQIEPKNADARFLLARISETRQDFRAMVTQLRVAVDTRPDFLEARLKLGTIYVLASALELAEEQYTAAAEFAPGDTGVHILHARLLAAQGDLESASKELEVALEQDPSNTQALGLLASVVATTDPDLAIEMISKGIAATDDNSGLRQLKIQLLQRSGDTEGVIREYRLLVDDFPDEDAYSYQLARFLVSEGRTDEVEQVLQELVERKPENNQAKLALVQFVSGVKGPEQAEALLKAYVDAAPDEHQLRLALGLVYQSRGQQDEAIETYLYIVEAAGNDDEALTAKGRLAALYLAKGDIEAGEALVDEILSIDSTNSAALLLSGALNFDRNKLKAAVSDMRTLLRNDPENVAAQLMLARAHAKARDDLLAKDAYRRVIEMAPNNGTAPLELVRLLAKDKELEQAKRVLDARLKQAPTDVSASRALIALYISQERVDAAEKEAERISDLPGNKAVGSYLLGSIYQVRDQHEKAISAFAIALQEEPSAREPLQGTVASLLKLGRTDEAVAMLENVISEFPENLYAQTLLSQVLAGSGEVDAAEALIESTLSSNREWLPAYTTLAGMQSGNVEAQIDIYKRGLEAMPSSQELALLLGTAYEREGKIEEAIAAYEKVLSDNPDLPAVANNLAALLADYRTDTRSWERALELVEKLEGSNNPAFIDTLGWVHYRLGNLDAAVPLLKQSVDLAGQVPVLRYHLGMAYMAQGENRQAEEQLTIATADAEAEYTGREEAEKALQDLAGT